MKKAALILIFILAFAWNCHAQTWTYVQDSVVTFCTGGSNGCSISAGTIVPTTAGTIWVLRIHTPNNATITSVSGGGGTWQLCPASSCHLFDSATSDNQDLAYNLSGNAGTTNISVTLSASAGSFFGANFFEILPPAGSTASFDAAGTSTSASCTACTGVGLNLTGTDAVIQVMSGNNAASWNSWSSPYITDTQNDGIGLNVTSGTAPTVAVNGPGADFSAIAFKSSLGKFTPPPAGPISLVNFTSPQGVNCNPSCSLPIPTTGSGHLLYVEAADLTGNYISSISGGGTWVIPSGPNTCRIALASTSVLSCAYVLSSTPGATSLGVTMTGTANASFTVSEVASSAGSFALDAQGSTTNPASPNPSGQALTLTGTSDVIFQASFIPGGSSGASFYPLTNGFYFMNSEAQQVELLNTTDGAAPVWVNQQFSATTVTGVAFKVGTATALAPPTGLTAVVH